MSISTPELDIHVLADTAELDAAAELAAGHMTFDPELTAQFYRRRSRPIAPPQPTPESIAYQKACTARLDALQFGAFDGKGLLISVAGLANKSCLTPGGSGQIVDVVTHYEYRRMGLGRAVIHTLEDYARREQLSELRIVAATRKGEYLYENLGYTWDKHLRGYTKALSH